MDSKIRDKFREENARLRQTLYSVESERDILRCENSDLHAEVTRLKVQKQTLNSAAFLPVT
jgi:hypothetical protein